jgi:uncharacterized protein YbjT (DUF2867 family)
VARVLIIGCGCRGQALARELVAAGHAVRGTTRDPRRTPDIEAAGAEAAIGDPDRIGTLMASLDGVTVVCWLLASARGDPEKLRALHDGRLRMLCERVVDTPVRGIVYEAAGSIPEEARAIGRERALQASRTWRIPLEILETDPTAHEQWLEDATKSVQTLLAP